MDPKNSTEMFKHLEKQNELLQEAHKKMSHELHRLQVNYNNGGVVEEEMLMRKFYELTSALGLNKKNELSKMASNDAENEESNALVNVPSEDQ